MKKININTWERKEYFDHYYHNIPCTYSMSFKIDITNIIDKKYKLYPTMIYSIINTVNKFDEFKTIFNENQELVVYDKMIPYYTVLAKDSNLFTSIYSDCDGTLNDFINQYNMDVAKYSSSQKMSPQKNIPNNLINISMIPWVSFEGFNLNLQKGYDYLLPIFTIGKYYKDNQSIYIPLAIQVHHAVCDGFHLSKFINELQLFIEKI